MINKCHLVENHMYYIAKNKHRSHAIILTKFLFWAQFFKYLYRNSNWKQSINNTLILISLHKYIKNTGKNSNK